jgi:hypothetical protein
MKNKYVKFLLIIFLFYSKLLYSQIQNQPFLKSTFQSGEVESTIEVLSNGDTVLYSKVNMKNTVTNNIEVSEKTYKGTPLYGNAWFSLGLIYLNGKPQKGNIAYNLVNNDVQFSAGELSKAISIKPDSFMINNVKFKKYKSSEAALSNSYFQTVYEKNKSQILREYICNYRSKVMGQKTGYELSSDNYEGSYIKSTAVYLAHNEAIEELKTNKSTFKIFAVQKETIEKYAKEKDLNIKKEADLIEITKHYLSL